MRLVISGSGPRIYSTCALYRFADLDGLDVGLSVCLSIIEVHCVHPRASSVDRRWKPCFTGCSTAGSRSGEARPNGAWFSLITHTAAGLEEGTKSPGVSILSSPHRPVFFFK